MNEILGKVLYGVVIFLGSALGTYGFAIFMHAPHRAWLPASLIGGLAYALYWALLQFSMYEPMAMFLAALVGSTLFRLLTGGALL